MKKSDDITEVKTWCCNADWYKAGRAEFRCKECDKDVTLEIVLLHNSMDDNL